MSEQPVSALDYLARPEKYPLCPVIAAFGSEAFLRRQVLASLRKAVLDDEEGSFSQRTFDGRAVPPVDIVDVLNELRTVAMFGAKKRLVIVEQADGFVSWYREQLEEYIARPSPCGVLLLELDSLPANTRLYKLLAAKGLLIDCKPLEEGRLNKWLIHWTQRNYNTRLQPPAAELLIEAIGPELGFLDQEVTRLSLSAGEGGTISPEMVRSLVSNWRIRTVWDMLDTALSGNVPGALQLLERLLGGGEQPISILAQVSASLRRFAAATQLVFQAEAAGRRVQLSEALKTAGVRPFVLEKAEKQLRRLGRHRGAQLYRWLLEADLHLKGESRLPPRLILERLIIRLAAPTEYFAKPATAGR